MMARYTFLVSDFSSSKDMMTRVSVEANNRTAAHEAMEQLWGNEPRFQRLQSIDQV